MTIPLFFLFEKMGVYPRIDWERLSFWMVPPPQDEGQIGCKHMTPRDIGKNCHHPLAHCISLCSSVWSYLCDFQTFITQKIYWGETSLRTYHRTLWLKGNTVPCHISEVQTNIIVCLQTKNSTHTEAMGTLEDHVTCFPLKAIIGYLSCREWNNSDKCRTVCKVNCKWRCIYGKHLKPTNGSTAITT